MHQAAGLDERVARVEEHFRRRADLLGLPSGPGDGGGAADDVVGEDARDDAGDLGALVEMLGQLGVRVDRDLL